MIDIFNLNSWRGKLIDGEYFASMCDYSVGDQSGNHNFFPNHKFEEVNLENDKLVAFLSHIQESNISSPIISIFVDTIRLAGLIPKNYRIDDEAYLEVLVQKNNLFDVIRNFPSIKFIIFCGLEDSELDNRINNIIPKNVIGIHSTHALSDSDLVEALPNGVQRTVNINEMYHPFLERFVDKRKYRVSKLRETFPSKSRLIYVNVNVGTNSKRVEMRDYFKDKRWAKVEKRRLKRIAYLKKVRRYPFILCPQGRAMGDTHREWEALYMGSVPVIEESGYLRKLYAGIPILFVRDFREVNREFLIRRLDLVSALRQMNLEKLDARRIYAQRLMWSIVKESGK